MKLGTRGSALALWQAEHVKARLELAGAVVEIARITTTGDRVQDRRLEAVGGKAAFLKEIEEALLAGEVDLAVHSLKDVPTRLPPGLVLAAILERADPRDALISREGRTLLDLAPGARVGTSSLRRGAQVKAARADLVIAELRGNVDTRLRRLHEGGYDAIVLAMAGLTRLGRASEATEAFDPRVFIPAPGQGALAIECREGDDGMRALAGRLGHAPTERAVAAERAMLAALGGGCNVPLGAHATWNDDGDLHLRAFVAGLDGRPMLRADAVGVAADGEDLGRRVADALLSQGAGALLGR